MNPLILHHISASQYQSNQYPPKRMFEPRFFSSPSNTKLYRKQGSSQHRQASNYIPTNRDPTPNQFAKNASAAYAKQQQPSYQSRPRAAPGSTQPAHGKPSTQPPTPAAGSRRASPTPTTSTTTKGNTGHVQDIGPAARGAQQAPNNILTRSLTWLSSTFAKPSAPNDPANPTNKTTYAYSVHSPQAQARSRTQASPAHGQHPPALSAALEMRQKLGYRVVSRRVLAAMVAFPVFVVTSWMLWKRLVRGEERKVFERDGGWEGIEPLHAAKRPEGVKGGQTTELRGLREGRGS